MYLAIFLIFTELTIGITFKTYIYYSIMFISYRTFINTLIVKPNKTVFTLSTFVTIRSGTFFTSLMASITYFFCLIVIVYTFYALFLVRVILITYFAFKTS